MTSSILNSTKKILGMDFAYTPFDTDIITHINAAFSVLNQLGIGPTDGFMIEDDDADWEDYDVPMSWMSLIKTYIYLKVRMVFDPPGTSYLIEAMQKQIDEYENRLSIYRETALRQLLNETEEVA